MHGGTYARKLLWRWHPNPLRRHDDIVEAWIVLSVWILVLVGGPVAALVTARAADDVFDRQRAERQPVRAVVLNNAPPSTPAMAGTIARRGAAVRWTASDGSPRIGRTLVNTGLKAGSTVTVWQDRHGRLTTAPPSPAEAAIESGFLGVMAAAGLAGPVFGTGAAARWRLDRRRADAWGREWDQVGPRWSHKTG
ncbi:hypothetical protein FNH09_07665 [Streptomyces adustus]|uniref:Uncharacterized protein n=1 Tax=Streptomyces adustus TaxID=1609272 RepID=A0A5N8V7E3_9ACTN|nr:hypothetical protein [Streptomyces adustus]MPY31190.1 hypothetical protein [Streptomyces adustus]